LRRLDDEVPQGEDRRHADGADHRTSKGEHDVAIQHAESDHDDAELIRRNDQIIDELDPADRAAVLDAIATTRRFRAQLRVTIPDRFKGINRPLRPTLVPRPAGGAC
jgi:hypothetical protein